MKTDRDYYKRIFEDNGLQLDAIKPASNYSPSVSNTARNGLPGIGIFKGNSFNSISGTGYYNTKETERAKKDILAMKEARHTDGYVSRPLQNVEHKMIADDFEFYIKNVDDPAYKTKVALMDDYFSEILGRSGYFRDYFFETLAHNVPYSNIFLHKQNDYMRNRTVKLTIMPPVMWVPFEKSGLSVLKWKFLPGKSSGINFRAGYKVYSYKNIIHLKFNHELGDAYGIPFNKPLLDDASLLREIENADAANFIDSTNSKDYVTVGSIDSGAKEEELEDVENYLYGLGDDIAVVSGRVEMKHHQVPRVEGKDIIDIFKNRVITSSGGSKTTIGESSSGRQSAEADADSEDQTVESYQTKLATQLNQNLFMRLNYELFGDNIKPKDMVFIKAKENFNKIERKEKHAAFLYQANIIDHKDLEKRMGTQIDTKNTYSKIYETESNAQGAIAQQTDPANQHGSRGSSRKSKKD